MSAFLYILLKKRIVFKDLLRHIRRIANVHGVKIKGDSFDLSGLLTGDGGQKLMEDYFSKK
jgi:hypothetical protein